MLYKNILYFRMVKVIKLVNMLDPGDPPEKACNIAVIPWDGKALFLTDCDSDGSDIQYYLPSRLLNAYAEPMQTDYEKNNIISDDELLLTIPSLPSIPALSSANNKDPKASTPKKVQSEELTASTSHGGQT